MFKYSTPLSLLLFGALTISCQGDFIDQGGDFNPSLNRPIQVLEGKFGMFDLFHLDSATTSQPVLVENELLNDELDLSSLIPQDSTYAENLGLLTSTQSFLVADHSDIVLSLNQLNFIQSFSPGDFSLFNSNNGNSITWAGCNSYANYYFGAVAVPEVFDGIHIDSALFDIALVNHFDFDVTIGVSLKSNPSILFSQVTTIASGDSANYSVLVSDVDANAAYHWTIYQVSSSGLAAGSAAIDNSNLFEVKVSRSDAYLSSGKFRPVNNILAQSTQNLALPVSDPHMYNYIEGRNLEFDNFVTAAGLGGTNLELHRSFKDKNGVVYSDVINVISAPATINWISSLSNLAIVPDQGMLEVSYVLQSAQNTIIDISANKSVSLLHGFQGAPELSAVGFKEDVALSFISKTSPYTHWPEELMLNFTPNQSSIERNLKFIGWGKVNIQSEFENHMGGLLKDSLQFNFGNSYLDSLSNQNKNWTLSNPNVNSFNALTPDSIEVLTNILFKAPWGMRLESNPEHTCTAFTTLTSSSGSAVLRTEKLLDLSSNQKLDSLIASCDSVSAFASIRSKTQKALYNTFSLTRSSDTILSFDRILLPGNGDESTTERRVDDPLSLNALMKFNYEVDFATPGIALNTTDSLFFELYLKLYGMP
jgi:hypothetical protein